MRPEDPRCGYPCQDHQGPTRSDQCQGYPNTRAGQNTCSEDLEGVQALCGTPKSRAILSHSPGFQAGSGPSLL